MNEGKGILIIEDDQEISKLLSVILTKLGSDVVVAYSGTKGLLQLQNNTFDLILLDLMLPGKSGEELIKEIRKNNSIPIIVISAKVDVENKVQVLKMGADDYITKPFNQKEVVARVEVQLLKSSLHPPRTAEIVWRRLIINTEKLVVSLENNELQLTKAEFDILSLFMNNPKHAVSKRKFMKASGKGYKYAPNTLLNENLKNFLNHAADFSYHSSYILP